MLFNSIEFLVFIPIVFMVYWFALQRSVRYRNFFLLIVSYLFYGWWDWRFLGLLLLSSIIDFLIGLKIGTTENFKSRKKLLALSLSVNLGVLGLFKYFNFFQIEFINLFSSLGIELNPLSIGIILPVGISFYTFQTLSYTIDVYRSNLEPSKDFIAFLAFVSFFPQLVAGPIERATNLLPQFYRRSSFNYHEAIDGLRQMLWGFFKKVVVADNCAIYVEQIFGNYESMDSLTLVMGSILFAFQIYGDFSGYSDIAIGCAKLLGFNLMRNFAFPYFSRDIAEFWRRWHISLSTWFRDYVYIPLGGSKGNGFKKFRNVLIIFVLSGFWHGANWTFIAWGVINALLFLPLMYTNSNRKNIEIIGYDGKLPSFREMLGVGLTFAATCIAWIFFRADSLTHAWSYIDRMLTLENIETGMPLGYKVMPYILLLLLFEWFHRRRKHALEDLSWIFPVRWFFYLSLLFIIFYFKPEEAADFIYFQF